MAKVRGSSSTRSSIRPAPPIRFNRDIPPKLEDIINQALEKDRNLRYQHAADMRADLQRLKRDTETGRAQSREFRHGGVGTGKRRSGSATAVASIQFLPALAPSPSSSAVQVGRGSRRRQEALEGSGSLPWYLSRLQSRVAFTIVHAQTTHRLTEKDTIVLADFANSTGDAVFDDTLKTALSVSLRQSPFLNVLSDSKVARL